MTRSELAQRLAAQGFGLTIQQAEKSIDVILGEITSALAQGNRVELRGFGVFTTRLRAARTGRNPRTGEEVTVSSKNVPFFKAGKELSQRLKKLS